MLSVFFFTFKFEAASLETWAVLPEPSSAVTPRLRESHSNYSQSHQCKWIYPCLEDRSGVVMAISVRSWETRGYCSLPLLGGFSYLCKALGLGNNFEGRSCGGLAERICPGGGLVAHGLILQACPGIWDPSESQGQQRLVLVNGAQCAGMSFGLGFVGTT